MAKQENSEIWKDIPGWEGYYQISSLQRIKSLERVVYQGIYPKRLKERLLKPCFDPKSGYVTVTFSRDGQEVKTRLHQVVALVFIPNPEGKPLVNHKNSIRNDNRIENLEWATYSEDRQHAYNKGRLHIFTYEENYNGLAKLTSFKAIEIKRIHESGELNGKQLAQKFNVSETAISRIITGRTWKNAKPLDITGKT